MLKVVFRLGRDHRYRLLLRLNGQANAISRYRIWLPRLNLIDANPPLPRLSDPELLLSQPADEDSF